MIRQKNVKFVSANAPKSIYDRCMAEYLHGFDPKEQERLRSQARFLEPWIYSGWSFSDRKNLLEVGCGVGAQTEILLRRYPSLRIAAVDPSSAQLEKAKQNLAESKVGDRVEFYSTIPSKAFDSAFICWVLEHVEDPVSLLKNVSQSLLPGARLVCIEVFNSTMQLFPRKSAIEKYWDCYNRLQTELGGAPDIGIRLGELLQRAGYKNISVQPVNFSFDCTQIEAREAFLIYWETLLVSGAELLLENKKIDKSLLVDVNREFAELRSDPYAAFFYTCMVANAEK